MYKKYCYLKSILLSVLLLLASQLADAQLQLSLTQGVKAATPLAVLAFTGPANLPSGDNMATVIRSDLSSTGQFNVPSLDTWQGNHDWHAAGMSDVLQGGIKADSNMRKVHVLLQNVLAASPANLINESYTISNDPGDLRPLTHSISDDVYQRLTGIKGIFSTRIAYVLVKNENTTTPDYALVVADFDGANPHTLLHSYWPIMSPSWSPDGKKLAYVSFVGNRAGVYVQTLADATRKKLLDAPGINGAPAFSPDGKSMAVVLTVSGNPNLYLVDLASGSRRQLTQGFSIDTEPSFSEDGSSLLFTSNRGGAPQIYKYLLSSGNIERVTFAGPYNADARYLPDGKSIVFMHRGDNGFSIATQDLATGQVQVLTRSGFAESPSIAPNGQMIIYATRISGRDSLAEVSIDGKVQLRLPSPQGGVREPAWSPFLT